MRVTRLCVSALLLVLAVSAFAQDPPQPPLPPGFPPMPGSGAKPAAEEKPVEPEVVSLTTADKKVIAGTYWQAVEQGGAGAVLLHMFGGDRAAWGPEVKHLLDRGVSVLAIDLRGHGGSAKQGRVDLAPRVQKRDPKLFAEMHEDAWAAVQWLGRDGRCDPARIALVGASVGCSVAIDTTRRHPDGVAAVLCMSPGAKYLGLDTLAHLKTFPAGVPLLLLVHRGEIEAGAQAIADARPGTRLVIYDDEAPKDLASDRAWAHGTKMFGRLPLVERTVASFVAAKTGSKTEDVVLDGVVGDGDGGDPWASAVDVLLPGSPGTVRAFRVGRRVIFGGTAPADCAGLRFEVQSGSVSGGGPLDVVGPPQVLTMDLATGRGVWTWGGMASIPNLPGMDTSKMFGKTWPVMRVVHTDAGTTFEGEWYVPVMGGEGKQRVKLVGIIDRTLHPGPKNGAMEAHPEQSKDLPARDER